MNGGSRIIDLRITRDTAPFGEGAPLPVTEEEHATDIWLDQEVTAAPDRTGMFLAIGALASLVWVAAMLWLARDSVGDLPPVELAQFVAALCVPPALIAILLILGLRNSRAEARRFGATAATMRSEAAQLDATVEILGERLAANRAMIADQASALGAIGGEASARVEDLGRAMGAEADVLKGICGALTRTASEVEARLGAVFEALPKAQAETIRLADALTAAGVSASERAALIEAQLDSLAQRSRTADATAGAAAARLADQAARMETMSGEAAARLDATADGMSHAVEAVLDRAADAIEEARRGIVAQGEAMLAMLSASHAALDKSSRDGAVALAERLAVAEGAIGRIGTLLADEQARGTALFGAIGDGIDATGAQLTRLHRQGTEQVRALTESIGGLDESVRAMGDSLRLGDGAADQLIGKTETLLVALDASAREIDETLPEALGRLDVRIAASRKIAATVRPDLMALVTAAETTHDAVEAVSALASAERDKLARLAASLSDALDAGRDKAVAMDAIIGDTVARTRRFADEAAPQLVDAVARIRESATKAADSVRETLNGVIPQAADRIEAASADAVRRGFERALPQPLAELSSASEHAVLAATRASEHLSQQLMTIAETTAAVEARIDAERTERETTGQDSFARRMSLLVEALNSAAIDIAKSFDHDVADTSWAAYLKGDRGVFTRRAVRLLNSQDAREVARLHASDPVFRDHVNRYIHDFEAMLRQVLALRDGSPLSVALLSSDAGKLYVALAQAIERLRA